MKLEIEFIDKDNIKLNGHPVGLAELMIFVLGDKVERKDQTGEVVPLPAPVPASNRGGIMTSKSMGLS